jgi:ABC-2 type transport system permease protein
MRKVLLIAAREYKAAVRTKAFLVSLLLMPLLMVGTSAIQYVTRKQLDTEDKRFAVIDRTPGSSLYPLLLKRAEQRNQNQLRDEETDEKTKAAFILEKIEPSADDPAAVEEQRLELSNRVLNGEYFGFIEIGPGIAQLWEISQLFNPKSPPRDRAYLRYQTNHPTYQAFRAWADLYVQLSIRDKLIENLQRYLPFLKLGGPGGGDIDLSKFRPLTLETFGLSKRDPKTGAIKDPEMVQQIASLLVPAGFVGLMLMVVMLGSTPAMQGIVEEKMQRIAEVMLGSVRPFQLMLGKLVGLMGVSLTIALVYLGGAYWAAVHYGFADQFSVGILAWYLVFQVLALLMYGSLFLAIGAAATDMKETQTLVLPVVLVCCLPLYTITTIIEDPNGKLAVGASFFPFTTPMLMMARLAVPPGIGWLQPLLGVLIVLATTLFCVYAAGRIFRVGILMPGKGARFTDLARWVIHG